VPYPLKTYNGANRTGLLDLRPVNSGASFCSFRLPPYTHRRLS